MKELKNHLDPVDDRQMRGGGGGKADGGGLVWLARPSNTNRVLIRMNFVVEMKRSILKMIFILAGYGNEDVNLKDDVWW